MPGSSWQIRLKILTRGGQRALDAYRLQQAKKRQAKRYDARFLKLHGRSPETPDEMKAKRKYMRGHPMSCDCFDCVFEPEEEAALRAPPIRQCRAATSL